MSDNLPDDRQAGSWSGQAVDQPNVQTNQARTAASQGASQTDQNRVADGQPADQLASRPTGQPISVSAGEQKEGGGPLFKEAEPRRVEQKEFSPPKEVKTYLEPVKKEEIELPQPVKDEYGQILIKSARPSRPKITLPLDNTQMQQAFKQKVTDSIRWLVTSCVRLIRMFPERVVFQTKKQN